MYFTCYSFWEGGGLQFIYCIDATGYKEVNYQFIFTHLSYFGLFKIFYTSISVHCGYFMSFLNLENQYVQYYIIL